MSVIRNYIKSYANYRKAAYISSAILSLMILSILCPVYLISDGTEATTGNATPSTLTFTSIRDTATVSLDITNSAGSFATSNNNETASFSLITNNATGYTLNLRTSGNNTNLTNTTNSSNTIASISSATASNSFTANTWGLIPNKYNSAVNTTNYYPASSVGFTIEQTNSANSSANIYTVGLGLKADTSIPAGTYTNATLLAEYVANPVSYTITYDKNTNDTVTNMPYSSTNNQQIGDTSATTITLSNMVPARDNYAFLGWCLGTVSSSNNTDTCTGTVYNPNGAGTNLSFGIDKTSTNNPTIYAMWKFNLLTINYDGNGLYYSGSPTNTVNTVIYDATSTTIESPYYYAHTDNVNDAGIQDGGYGSQASFNNTITIPGATTLNVSMHIGLYAYDEMEADVDYLYVIEGEYTGDPESAYGVDGFMFEYSGDESGSYYEDTFTVNGDTVTFALANYYGELCGDSCYGYYAIVQGLNADGEPYLTNYNKTTYTGSYDIPNYNAGGYTSFLGWSENPNDINPTYLSESDIKTNIHVVNGDSPITLYAIYRHANTAMQFLDISDCPTTGIHVYDSRDNQIYLVKKLADNNCWMLDNLMLDLANPAILASISSDNTNASATSINYLKGITTRDAQTNRFGRYATSGVSNWTTDYSRSDPLATSSFNDYFVNNINGKKGKTGSYYNYCAMSAGNYCFGNGGASGSAVVQSSGNATEDICPAGWRIPTGDSSGEYNALYVAYSSNAISFGEALSLNLAGYYYNGYRTSSNKYGYLWSSTRKDNYYMYGLSFNPTSTNPNNSYMGREFGYSVRCVMTPYLAITVDSNVSNITIKEGSDSGRTITGIRTGNTIVFKNLIKGTNYYLYPTYNTNYEFSSWTKTDSAIGSVLGSTNIENTYYTFGSDNGTLTLTSRLYPYTITFKTSNASDVVFNGITYTNNQTALMPTNDLGKTFHIYGNYGSRYAFSSWNATAGSFGNQNYQNTTYTVSGNATITLSGQQVTLAMQNLADSNCTTTARPVYDNRDNTIYWIQKLPDNKCWMLDNLALDLTDSTIVNTLSTSNTSLNATALTYFKNGGGTASDIYPITAYGTFSTNSYSQPLTDITYKNLTLTPSNASSYTNSKAGAHGLGQNKVGGFYNYCAATVGNNCYGNGTSSDGYIGSNNTSNACPIGWHIPIDGEFNTLFTSSDINSDVDTFLDALSLAFSGYHYSNTTSYLGTAGSIWEMGSSSTKPRLYVTSSEVKFVSSARYYGHSIRCVHNS